MKLTKEVRDVLWGNPFGEVYPRRPTPIPPVYDGRTAALRILRKYISELTFYRPGGKDVIGNQKDPIAFSIAERDIHVERPDDEEEMRLPALALLAKTNGDYEAIGMTSVVEEDSFEKYAPGTVLIWMSEYSENFDIEIWAETKQQRRAITLGLEQALSPIEQMAGIRFLMPDYYEQLVCFELQTREVIEDDTDLLVRRKAKMEVQMRFNVVALVPVNLLEPAVDVLVDADEKTGLGIENSSDDGAPQPPNINPGPGNVGPGL
jgi:hypothetical protein